MAPKRLPAEDPLRPKFGVLATLQDDLLHFQNEMKFLMLFFDKPVGLMTNVGFNYISEEAVTELKKGRQPRTSGINIGKPALKNLNSILSEDWESIVNHCEIEYQDLNISFGHASIPPESMSDIESVKGLPLSEYSLEELNHVFEKGALTETEKEYIFAAIIMRWQMLVFRDTLDRAVQSGRTLVWDGDESRYVCNMYVKHLLEKLAAEGTGEESKARATLAQSLGTSILRDLFSCNAFNLLSVPPHRIAEFRRKNRDLLVSFQDEYWSFVSEIKASPDKIDLCRDGFETKMRQSLRALEGEISTIRRKTGYEWLRRIGDDVYRYALAGTGVAATLSWLASPSLILAPAAAFIVAQAAKMGSDYLSEREQIKNTLERSSFGYIWRAKQKFGTD